MRRAAALLAAMRRAAALLAAMRRVAALLAVYAVAAMRRAAALVAVVTVRTTAGWLGWMVPESSLWSGVWIRRGDEPSLAWCRC